MDRDVDLVVLSSSVVLSAVDEADADCGMNGIEIEPVYSMSLQPINE